MRAKIKAGKPRDLKMRMGHVVELRFWIEALKRGVIVSRPHEGARYDFLVDNGLRVFRVQVKSTTAKVQRCFRVNAFGGSGIRYAPREVDILAAYIIPQKEWWIIPLRALKGSRSAVLSKTGRLRRYCEAWSLLLDKRQRTYEMQAEVDPLSEIDARTASDEELVQWLVGSG